MRTGQRFELGDEKRAASRARRRLAVAGAAAAVLPGCMFIANLSQFNGAVEVRDAGDDGAVADTSLPPDVASDDVTAGDAATDDATTDDATTGDDATGADDADADAEVPALPPDAATVTCPTTINGAIDTNSPTQIGRHSRNSTSIPSVCGVTQMNPGNGADPTNPHFYAVYRFSNPTPNAACFNFMLTYDGIEAGSETDAGDAAPDEAGLDAGSASGPTDAGVPPGLQKYMVAYSTFYPTNILSSTYLADVGWQTQPPQPMGVVVPAGGTIDVVIEDVPVAPGGVDTYTLTCATQ